MTAAARRGAISVEDDMKIAVVGSGGREHAIIKALAKSPLAEKIYALPGNGGMSDIAECVAVGAKDIPAIVRFAVDNAVDYVVVAPDDPLVLGAVDALEEAGVPCFGPRANAAVIEGSKAFAKGLMARHGIPTAHYADFSDEKAALGYIDGLKEGKIVVKADGLALGKGVIIAENKAEAAAAVRSMMSEGKFGASGNTVVIEEFLTGPEVSVLAFTDGETVVPMVSSMDHKRALTGDLGLNTGGMGTVAPNPCYTDEIAAECMEKIFLPTVRAMKEEGRPFKGCLYFGLMLTPDGPKVIEYNCRFGDPETQVVLPLLESDLLEIMLACTEGRLAETEVRFSDKCACCVVVASEGYPASYKTGYEIDVDGVSDADVYFAGAKRAEGKLVTSGGRVLGVTATAETLADAVKKAYAETEKVHFANAYFRHDIGARALAALDR